MNTIILLAAAALAAPGQGLAGKPMTGPSMTASDLTVAQWTARIGSTMEDHMAQDRTLPHMLMRPLVAQVSFRCSESGRPSEVSLVAPSGSARFDAAAIRTVASIPTLHPLPPDISYTQRYRAVLFYAQASDAPAVAARVAAMRDKENAWIYRRPSISVLAPGRGTID